MFLHIWQGERPVAVIGWLLRSICLLRSRSGHYTEPHYLNLYALLLPFRLRCSELCVASVALWNQMRILTNRRTWKEYCTVYMCRRFLCSYFPLWSDLVETKTEILLLLCDKQPLCN